MKKKTWFIDFIKGLSLGLGVLPGVSMATVGFFVDIYEKLINGVNGLRKHFKQSFLTILPIFIGSLTSALILYLLVNLAFKDNRCPMVVLFICAGITVGGFPLLWKEFAHKKLGLEDYVRFVVGFIIAALVGVLSALNKEFNWLSVGDAFVNPNQNWWIYIAVPVIGFIASVACMMPGVSGTMILFVAGVYQPLLDLFIGDKSMFKNHAIILPGIIIIIELALGIIAGVFAMSSIMNKLLTKHRRGVYGWVIGLVLGSIVAIFVNNSIWDFYKGSIANSWWQYLVGGIVFLVLVIVINALIKKKNSKETQMPVSEVNN